MMAVVIVLSVESGNAVWRVNLLRSFESNRVESETNGTEVGVGTKGEPILTANEYRR